MAQREWRRNNSTDDDERPFISCNGTIQSFSWDDIDRKHLKRSLNSHQAASHGDSRRENQFSILLARSVEDKVLRRQLDIAFRCANPYESSVHLIRRVRESHYIAVEVLKFTANFGRFACY